MTGRDVLEARMAAFSAAKHPRDKMGRFASKAGGALARGARAVGRSALRSGRAENLGGSFGRGVGAATGMRIGGHIGKHVGRKLGKNEDLGDAIGSLAGGALGQRLGRDAGDSAGRRVGMKPVGEKSFARRAAGVAGFMAAGQAELPSRRRSGADGFHPGVARDIASAVRRGSRTGAEKFAERMGKTVRLRNKFAYRDASVGGKAAIRARGLAKAMKKALKKRV